MPRPPSSSFAHPNDLRCKDCGARARDIVVRAEGMTSYEKQIKHDPGCPARRHSAGTVRWKPIGGREF